MRWKLFTFFHNFNTNKKKKVITTVRYSTSPVVACLLLLLPRAARFWRGLREATTIGLALLLLLLLFLPRAEVVLFLAEAFLGRLFRGEKERKRGLRFSNNDDTVVIFFRFCKNEELFLLPLFRRRRRRRRSRNRSETEFSRARIYQSLNSPCSSSARQPLERF